MQPQDAALIAASLATVGWVYTNRRTRMLSRKQHTINVMLQSNMSKDFRDALLAIREEKRRNPGGECPDLDDHSHANLATSVRFVANYMEFLAAGLRNGDFDERLIRDCMRSHIVDTFDFYEPHVIKIRNSRHHMSIYEHTEWLVARWTTNKPNFAQRFWEYLVEKPLSGKRVNI